MRFSIRSLLAIILLCGLLFPVIQGLRLVRRDLATSLELQNEIEILRTNLAVDDPKIGQLHRHQAELFDSVARARERAEQQFARIQQKYGQLSPAGPDTFSLRGVPQIGADGNHAPVVFRMHVPADRDVYLKYAVVPTGADSSQDPEELDRLQDPVVDSGYKHNGPYETKLSAGERVVTVGRADAVHHLLPLEFLVDGGVLLETQFAGQNDITSGMSYIAGHRQFDVPTTRELPWLLGVRISEKLEFGGSERVPFQATLWLSDRSSGFEPFPGDGGAAEARGGTP